MKDKTVKSVAAFLIRNKEVLSDLMEYFHPNDIERGRLLVPEELLNGPLKRLILMKAKLPVSNYTISFAPEVIQLHLQLDVKQLGPISARYQIMIDRFVFNPKAHQIAFRYKEEVRPLGSPMQAMMLRTVMGQNTLLARALDFSRIAGIRADNNQCAIDLSRFSTLTTGTLSGLTLEYLGTRQGFVDFNFDFGQ